MKKTLKILLAVTLLAAMLMALVPTGASALIVVSDLPKHNVYLIDDGRSIVTYYIISYDGIRYGPYVSLAKAVEKETELMAKKKGNTNPPDTTKKSGSYAGK